MHFFLPLVTDPAKLVAEAPGSPRRSAIPGPAATTPWGGCRAGRGRHLQPVHNGQRPARPSDPLQHGAHRGAVVAGRAAVRGGGGCRVGTVCGGAPGYGLCVGPQPLRCRSILKSGLLNDKKKFMFGPPPSPIGSRGHRLATLALEAQPS